MWFASKFLSNVLPFLRPWNNFGSNLPVLLSNFLYKSKDSITRLELGLPKETAIISEANAIAERYIIVCTQECDLQREFHRTIDIGGVALIMWGNGTSSLTSKRWECPTNLQNPKPIRIIRDSCPVFPVTIWHEYWAFLGVCCEQFERGLKINPIMSKWLMWALISILRLQEMVS
jgi:hypothetical protein